MAPRSRWYLACVLSVHLAACGGSAGPATDGSAPLPDAEIPTPGDPGPPGCGLAAAAFCDPFDAPAGTSGREGELDPARWSVSRMTAGLPTADGNAVAIGTATIPPCRVGLPEKVLPDQDALVCDTIGSIHSNHLLTAAAAQNYGQSSHRIRQPFDFAGRTGRIVFDATAVPGGLLGWVSIAVTGEPTEAPSYTRIQNEENGALPRNALEIHFNQNCQREDQVSATYIIVYDDYVQHLVTIDQPHCVSMRPDALNHFQIDLSRDHVRIAASPASDDGVTFAPVELLAEADIALPFSRGWVQLNTHNHASLKYSDNTRDAWIARWDNVGFDGPVIDTWREASIPDALTVGADGKRSVGYRLDDIAKGPGQALAFSAIDPAGATQARIVANTWLHLEWGTPADFVVHYRVNGGADHTWKLSPSQLQMISALPVSGTLTLELPVDPAELVAGSNTVQFATEHVPLSYPPMIANVDLVLTTP